MIELKPTIYSKSREVNKLLMRLRKAPYQVENSPAVFESLIAEFIMNDGPDYGQSVGTLNEYYKEMKETMYTIHCIDGVVIVERSDDGKFIARSANIFQEIKNLHSIGDQE